MKTKEGKIFIISRKNTDNYSQDIHPRLFIKKDKKDKKKGMDLIITHNPPLGVDSIKITQKDVYGIKLQGGFSYITDEVADHKEGHVIGGIKQNLLQKILKKFAL